jgi:hypothetical protein
VRGGSCSCSQRRRRASPGSGPGGRAPAPNHSTHVAGRLVARQGALGHGHAAELWRVGLTSTLGRGAFSTAAAFSSATSSLALALPALASSTARSLAPAAAPSSCCCSVLRAGSRYASGSGDGLARSAARRGAPWLLLQHPQRPGFGRRQGIGGALQQRLEPPPARRGLVQGAGCRGGCGPPQPPPPPPSGPRPSAADLNSPSCLSAFSRYARICCALRCLYALCTATSRSSLCRNSGTYCCAPGEGRGREGGRGVGRRRSNQVAWRGSQGGPCVRPQCGGRQQQRAQRQRLCVHTASRQAQHGTAQHSTAQQEYSRRGGAHQVLRRDGEALCLEDRHADELPGGHARVLVQLRRAR